MLVESGGGFGYFQQKTWQLIPVPRQSEDITFNLELYSVFLKMLFKNLGLPNRLLSIPLGTALPPIYLNLDMIFELFKNSWDTNTSKPQ